MIPKSQIVLAAALLLAGVVKAFADRIDPYFALIISNIGINVILAVSLNLINGYTGQFSLGHAGFMAVGAYTAAAITMFGAPKFAPGLTQGAGIHALFPLALVGGGLAAALAGLLVGAPSLRLKGDYLAIVTLGFGEIIRVIFRNVDSLGGALGLNGIPAYTNLFWVYAFAALTVYVVVSLVNSTYGRGFLAVHDDEIAAEAMGINTTRYKIQAFVVGAKRTEHRPHCGVRRTRKLGPDVGMVGCLIRNPDGTEQAGSRRAHPTPWRSLVRVLHLDKWLARHPRSLDT